MIFEGFLRKMRVVQDNATVQYYFSNDFEVSSLVGAEIKLEFLNEIRCVSCDKKINKTFSDGYCFPCFNEGPENSPCVIRPELCRAHLGEGRDLEWEETNHNIPHIVYLAQTDVVKVGVTRKNNLVNRWIDQGAYKALILAETPNRFEAGRIEVAMKDLVTDRTNWRKMLTNDMDENIDLADEKWRFEELLPMDLQHFFTDDDEPLQLEYPVEAYPNKVVSAQLLKTNQIQGKLSGIRGQYFIFENGTVLNIRKHSGYKVSLEVL